jgi:hypothetical protein
MTHIPDDRELLADRFEAWVKSYSERTSPPGCLLTPAQSREVGLFADIYIALRSAALPKQDGPSREELEDIIRNQTFSLHQQVVVGGITSAADKIMTRLVSKPDDDGVREKSADNLMSLRCALSFADEPRLHSTLQAPADTMEELYEALRAAPPIRDREAIAETIWRAEYRRATGKERTVSWADGVSEADKDGGYRYIADALSLPSAPVSDERVEVTDAQVAKWLSIIMIGDDKNAGGYVSKAHHFMSLILDAGAEITKPLESVSGQQHPKPGGVKLTKAIHRIEHDAFEGSIIGEYTTREGKRGVVLQQTGTKVVHVYSEKWLTPK